jgi:hypothetical protein
MRKAFNMAACAVGGLITAATGFVFAAGFAGCGDDAIGACINPFVLTQTPYGLLATGISAAIGIGLIKYGYSRLQAVPKP